MRLSSSKSNGRSSRPIRPRVDEAEAFVKAQPFWYHRIYLGNGIYTMPGDRFPIERGPNSSGVYSRRSCTVASMLDVAAMLVLFQFLPSCAVAKARTGRTC